MSFHHASLNAKLNAVAISTSPAIRQYRNLKFASIPARFTHSVPIDDWDGATIGSATHGPRCPQLQYDLNTLFRIPAKQTPSWKEAEDEFECLNLHVTVPEGLKAGDDVPVLVWIHGGSMVATVGSAGTLLCDPTKLVAASIAQGSPLIFVGINYRLAFLGFTYISDELTNFGLFDQRHAIEWVHRHIRSFGGDPANITVGGESAGSVCTHLQTLSTSAPFSRAILQSGTVFTTPPQPPSVGAALTTRLLTHLSLPTPAALTTVPLATLLRAQSDLSVNGMAAISSGSFWRAPDAAPWGGTFLLGDCERESSLWTTGLSFPPATLPDSPATRKIVAAYNITPDSPASLLRFVGDAKFSYHNHALQRSLPPERVYRYLFDAPNPWVPEAGAHHAVDLLYLFGGVEMGSAGAEAVGEAMRRVWVRFVSTGRAWEETGRIWVFSEEWCGVVDDEEVARRRRVEQWRLLEEVGVEVFGGAVGELVKGKLRFE